MASIFGDDEEQRTQSLGLLGLLMGGGILAGNQPGASMGQALGQGLNQGVSGLMQMQGQRSNQELRALQMQKIKSEMDQKKKWQTMFGGGDTPAAPGQVPAAGPGFSAPPASPSTPAPQQGVAGIPPNLMSLIGMLGPEKGGAILAQQMTKTDSVPEDIKKYQFAQGQGFTGTFQDYQQAQKTDNSLVEIYAPDSPTQTRMVPRSQAVNQPGKPASGLTFESDGQGGFRVVQGRGAGSGMSQPTANKIDEKLINSGELLTRLTDVQSQFKPEFLQLGTRAGMAVNSLKDFVGVNLDDASKSQLSDYAGFRRASVNNINRILNELSGAAVSPSEGDRLKAAYPNAGIGIFDGDTPTEFKRKMDDTTRETRNAILRYNYAKSNGMNPLKTGVELQDVPALVEKRGAAIEALVKQAMPNASPDAIKLETRARLAAEFGMSK